MSNMETSLDKRLRELLTNKFGYSETQGDMVDDLIAQIKNAFKEEDERNHKLVYDLRYNYGKVMTGKAFYDRFEKELNEVTLIGEKPVPYDLVRMVARRAAGLEGEES